MKPDTSLNSDSQRRRVASPLRVRDVKRERTKERIWNILQAPF